MSKSSSVLLFLLLLVTQAQAKEAVCGNFFNALKHSDKIIVIKIAANGTIEALEKLNGDVFAETIHLPDFFRRRFSSPGSYLLPIKEQEAIPFFPPMPHAEASYSATSRLLEEYPQKATNNEFCFLKELVCATNQALLREAALLEMREIGIFDSPLDGVDIDFFLKLYFRSELTIPERRLLLEELGKCNFMAMPEVFRDALQDLRLSALAGRIFAENDPQAFASLLQQYIRDDERWASAIRHSEFMIANMDFCQAALARYNYDAPPENAAGFIPLLLCAETDRGKNIMAVKYLLTHSKDTNAFELYRNLGSWLNKTDPEPYRKEIEYFLRNNRKNDYIYNSIVYPAMLAAFCKTADPGARQMAVNYLQYLRQENNLSLSEAVCLLFKGPEQPNPSLDELIETLTALP